MTLEELEQEITFLGIPQKRTDRGHLIHVLRVYDKAFSDQASRLCGLTMHSLRWMTPNLEVDIDIFYPYSKWELVGLIAESLAVRDVTRAVGGSDACAASS